MMMLLFKIIVVIIGSPILLIVVLVRLVWEIMVLSKEGAIKAKKNRIFQRFGSWLNRVYFRHLFNGSKFTSCGLYLILKFALITLLLKNIIRVCKVMKYLTVKFSEGCVHTMMPIIYVLKNIVLRATIWLLDILSQGIGFTVIGLILTSNFIGTHIMEGIKHTYSTTSKLAFFICYEFSKGVIHHGIAVKAFLKFWGGRFSKGLSLSLNSLLKLLTF